MTSEEYQEAKAQIAEYERLASLRDTYTRIKNTADLVIVRCRDGQEIRLTGAEPIAALQAFLFSKLDEIDQEKALV